MKKMWMMVVLSMAGLLVASGCSFSSGSGDDDDSETDSDTQDTSDSEDSDTGSDSEDPIDTENDGVGGLNQSCYSTGEGVDEANWCDGDLVPSECSPEDTSCCCRMPCAPAMCDEDREIYCLNDDDGFLGICNYPEDDQVVGYTCDSVCVPRSQCIDVEELTGECNDIDADESGGCVPDKDEPDDFYCRQPCLLVVDVCPDDHLCEPAQDVVDGSYDGTGICVPEVIE